MIGGRSKQERRFVGVRAQLTRRAIGPRFCRVFGEVVYDVELSLNLWTTQALQKPLTKCAPLG
ncbi:MAG: hypothetical protein ABSG41_29600, partial [Bryobacteraceae bacterium]